MTLRLQYYQPQDCSGGPERKHSGSPLRLTLPVRSALHTCRMLGYDSVCAGPAGMRVRRWHRDECGVLLEGGLEVWDKRRPGKSQLRSPLSWGLTGSPALDASHVRVSHPLLPVASLSCACLAGAARHLFRSRLQLPWSLRTPLWMST